MLVSRLRYPAVVRLPGADAVLILTVVLLAAYSVCAGWALRRPLAGQRAGLVFGALAGALWSAEIWCGGPARLSHTWEQLTGGTFLLLAVAVTVTAGVLAGSSAAGPAGAWQAGLYTGLVSGVFVYVFAVTMTLSTLPILASRADYQAQFARSGAPSMNVFLVGDILAAVAAHLVINSVLGLLGGCLGAAAARRRTRRAATAQ